MRPKDTASSAKDAAAIATIPAASASMPSMRFTRFATSAIHRSVIGTAATPKSTIPRNGMPMRSNVMSKPMTGTQATSVTARSFVLAERPRTSSTMPTAATSGMPMTMPRIAPLRSRNSSAGTRMPTAIARPPIRGIGSPVDARPVAAVVEQVVAHGEPPHDRGERERERGSHEEAPRDRGLRHQAAQRIGERHGDRFYGGH